MITRFMLSFAIIVFNIQARDLDINAKLTGGDYVLQNIDGKNTSLEKIKKANGLLVIFSCNTILSSIWIFMKSKI